ncbi:hypothetical protein KKG81_04475 [bacterium]|nr:hypothetical protein [bacterium]
MAYLNGIIKFFEFLFSFKRFIPIGVSVFFVIASLVQSGIMAIEKNEPMIFIKDFGYTITALDYKTYQMVKDFEENPEEFTFFKLFTIFSYIYIFFFVLAKGLSKLFYTIQGGSTSPAGQYFLVLILLFTIELASVRMLSGEWFLPFKGWFVFLINIGDIIYQLRTNPIISEKFKVFKNSTVSL